MTSSTGTSTTGAISMMVPLVLGHPWKNPLSVSVVIDCLTELSGDEEPRIVEHPDDQFVVRNEPATLNCKASGRPAPVVTWYRYGLPVTTANDNPTSHRMLLPSGQLFFLRVQHSSARNASTDLGVYYCNATSPRTGASAVSREASLELAGTPPGIPSFTFTSRIVFDVLGDFTF